MWTRLQLTLQIKITLLSIRNLLTSNKLDLKLFDNRIWTNSPGCKQSSNTILLTKTECMQSYTQSLRNFHSILTLIEWLTQLSKLEETVWKSKNKKKRRRKKSKSWTSKWVLLKKWTLSPNLHLPHELGSSQTTLTRSTKITLFCIQMLTSCLHVISSECVMAMGSMVKKSAGISRRGYQDFLNSS